MINNDGLGWVYIYFCDSSHISRNLKLNHRLIEIIYIKIKIKLLGNLKATLNTISMRYKFYSALFHLAKFLPGSARQSLGCHIRITLLRKLVVDCGREINVLGGAEIGCPHNLAIGDNSAIGLGCYLSCIDKVSIGDRVLMGPGVMIFTSNHVWNPEELTYFRQGEALAPVTIKDDSWIGARSIILPGVVIGRGCTVAAGAVVTRSTADYSVVAGVPAVQIGTKPIGGMVAE